MLCLDWTCALVLSAHFFACPIGRSSKIARLKNRATRKKFSTPVLMTFWGITHVTKKITKKKFLRKQKSIQIDHFRNSWKRTKNLFTNCLFLGKYNNLLDFNRSCIYYYYYFYFTKNEKKFTLSHILQFEIDYLQPCRKAMLELFVKMVNGF